MQQRYRRATLWTDKSQIISEVIKRESIVIYNQEACGGSCAEGHVSHVLSSRLSSRPMGWSRAGLTAMAELRAFCSNGGHIELKHIKASKPLAYRLNRKPLAEVAKTF